MQLRLMAGGALVAVLAVSLADAPAQPGRGKVYATPQDVFAAADKAAKKDDWKALYSCLTPDSRETITGGLVFMGVMFKGFAAAEKTDKAKESVKAIDATFKKYGLTKDALAKVKLDKFDKIDLDVPPKQKAVSYRKYATTVKDADRAAFVADMLKVIEKEDKKMPKGKGALKDLKIEGDTARGTLVVKLDDGTESSEPITFKKVGGGWLMDVPLDGPPRKKAPAPTPPKE